MDIQVTDKLQIDWWKSFVSPTPFQTFWYLDLFREHFVKNPYLVTVKNKGKLTALFPFEREGERLIVLGMKKVFGKEELTDYDAVLTGPIDDLKFAETATEVMSFLRGQGIREIVFDYVREDSRLYRFLHILHFASSMEQVVAPFILLPPTWEGYLDILDRVERKELKRKLKRLDTVGHSFVILPAADDAAIDDFIRLQRASDEDKEQFMSASMEKFFRDLCHMVKDEWPAFFAVLKIEDTTAASILFFEQKTTAMLYNSGFDPQSGRYSSGLMAHALLIKRNIETGKKIHDFMRGNERYKYDLGARDVNLYKISINL